MKKNAMTLQLKKQILAVVLACLCMAGAAAHAAVPGANFKRLNFAFGVPTHLTIDNKGTTVVLHFSTKLQESRDTLKAQLAGYATDASLSPSGKELTLTMVKPYRIRQFTGSSGIGIDIVGAADLEAAAEAKAKAAAKAEKSAEPEAVAKTSPKSPAVKQAAQSITPLKQTTDALLTTKAVHTTAAPEAKVTAAEAPAVAALTTAAVAPTAPAKAKAADNVYTTKPTAAAAPTPTASPPPAPVKPEEDVDAAMLSTAKHIADGVKKEAAAKPAPAADAKESKDTKAPEAPRASAHKAGDAFVVTAHNTASATIINFPWRERTAAAVFERARDIWIVFSHPVDMHVPLLRTVLPKPVVDITQYNYPGNTVLRLTTDGSIHAAAELAKGTYDWNVTLGTAVVPAKIDVSVKADTTYGTRQLLLGAFDVSDALRFYDPHIGDLMIIIPSYEGGRGVLHERKFPEFTMLNTNQGIIIASTRADLGTQISRAGVAVYTDDGLSISEDLPTLVSGNTPVSGVSTPSDVMFPYDQWYVAPVDFYETLQQRLNAAANASAATKPDALLSLATLYLGMGWGTEAHGYLSIIQQESPDYYKTHKLALLHAASYILMNQIPDAAQELSAPELTGMAEADLWREVVALYAPPASATQKIQQAIEKPDAPATAPAANAAGPALAADGKTPATKLSFTPTPTGQKSIFHFLKYNQPYIHFYPPRIRQQLAQLASAAYIQNDELDKALAVFDTLSHDDIGGPLKMQAEYTLALIAIEKKHPDQALDMLGELAKQNIDAFVKAEARYTMAILHYNEGDATADETAEQLQMIHLSWRGDVLGRKILDSLVQLYQSGSHYDEMLRTWRTILDEYPNDPDTLIINADMGDLFQNLYLHGLADSMPPLQSLSLFYEFRDLTPVGATGDEIIRRLADRLAAFDLLDRATQLLENQIKFRVTDEERSRVGARLALLHLLNHEPKEARDVLQITDYGSNPPELARQRLQLAAEALNSLGKHEEALSMLTNDTSRDGALLRLDILWSMQDWPNVVSRAEDILSARHNLTAPLTPEETEVLLKLAIGYSFQGDNTQLRYLRDYYMGLIPDTAYKQIFDFITNDTAPLDPADVALLTQQISHTESFLSAFKAKIAAGKLSEAVK